MSITSQIKYKNIETSNKNQTFNKDQRTEVIQQCAQPQEVKEEVQLSKEVKHSEVKDRAPDHVIMEEFMSELPQLLNNIVDGIIKISKAQEAARKQQEK